MPSDLAANDPSVSSKKRMEKKNASGEEEAERGRKTTGWWWWGGGGLQCVQEAVGSNPTEGKESWGLGAQQWRRSC